MNRISLLGATTFAAMLAAAPAVALAQTGSQGANGAGTSNPGMQSGTNAASQSTMNDGTDANRGGGSTLGQAGTAGNEEPGEGGQLSMSTLKNVQQQLQQAGYYKNGRVDGKWGPGTSHAIMAFQQSKGMQATGHLDQKTLDALGVSQGG